MHLNLLLFKWSFSNNAKVSSIIWNFFCYFYIFFLLITVWFRPVLFNSIRLIGRLICKKKSHYFCTAKMCLILRKLNSDFLSTSCFNKHQSAFKILTICLWNWNVCFKLFPIFIAILFLLQIFHLLIFWIYFFESSF